MEARDGNSWPRASILEYLRADGTSNLFAIYDLLKEPENTSIRLAVDGGKIMGYLLRYEGLSNPNVVIRGEDSAVSRLLDEVSGEEKMLLFLDSDQLERAKTRLNPTAIIPEDLMVVEPGGTKAPAKNIARRLGPGDGPNILELYSGRSQVGEDSERFAKWTARHVVYGVFQDGVLVSVAGTWTEAEDGWIIGGVYTSPPQRNNGFASMTTSAVTEEALKDAHRSALFVVSSNRPAIHVYEKLGYWKVGERLWVDLGTGEKPLTT